MGFDPPVRRCALPEPGHGVRSPSPAKYDGDNVGGDISGVTRGLREGGPESVWVVRRYEFGRFAANFISTDNQT